MTYEQRLRQIAEEFARKRWPEIFEDSQFNEDDRAETINAHKVFAEIAIRREGEMFDSGVSVQITGQTLQDANTFSELMKNNLGLIKPTTDALDNPITTSN